MLSAVVNQTNAHGFRHHLPQQIQLRRNGNIVRGTGYIPPGSLHALHQASPYRIRHGGNENGNIFRCVGHSLGRRGSDGQNQVRLVLGKLLGNGLGDGHIGLGILVNNPQILTFLITVLLQHIKKPLPRGIQGWVCDKLDDSSCYHFFFRRFFLGTAG
ncbi:MAG: hypothetical protein LOD91_03245, partial [Limnochordales bacterium]